MSLPAANLPAPIAVLILAWDEAAPAVRALVEATQAKAPTVDSVLVMVPQAAAPDHLSAEEYLPLPNPTDDAALAQAAPQPADFSVVAPPPATAPASLPLASAAPSQVLALDLGAGGLAPLALPLSASLAQEDTEAAPAALGWAEVRVLRLGNYSLSQLAQRAGQPLPAPIWTGTAELPAAPYLGATLPTTLLSVPSPTAYGTAAVTSLAASTLPNAATPASEATRATSSFLAVVPPLATTPRADFHEPAEPQPQAALETDLPPSAEETEVPEPGTPDEMLREEPVLPPSAVQAGWPEALTTLRQPATLAEPMQTAPVPNPVPAPASSAPATLQPTAVQYPAPDLNFQVIQYARFAVPVALAEPEFAAIYAPAWPTWLAAQELRQRTGRPLVLHVSTLAAADGPVGTATGWMAELQRQALQRADLILTETPALAERLRRELGLPFAAVQAIAAADALAIAQALHTAQARPAAGRS